MLNRLNLQAYSILSILNLGMLYYLVMEKGLLYLTVFPLMLLNQASLYYLVGEMIRSVNNSVDKVKMTALVVLKFGSLIAIGLFIKRYNDEILAMGACLVIQTIIFAISLKTGSEKS